MELEEFIENTFRHKHHTISAIYNTFIETCKSTGVSFRDYFYRLLREFKKGRTDYEDLLPITICKYNR